MVTKVKGSVISADGISYTPAGTGAVTTNVQDKLREFKSLTDFGTDTAALQAAVDSFPTDGGELWVPAAVYNITDTIHVSKPVLIRCEGRGDLSTNANTDGTLSTTFRWSGAADGYMFVFSASTATDMLGGATTGEVIFGGGLVNCLLDGQNTAGYGVWAASTSYSQFDFQAREFKNTALLMDGGNGALSVRNEINLHVVWGTQPDSQPMNGVHFRRYNSYPSTQNRVISANGLIYNGDLIVNQDTDNNIMWHVHGVTQSGGSGRAISFLNGVTNSARNNVVYYVNGDVYAESSTFGNRILHHNSEGSYINVVSGGQIHYDTIDYVNAEVWGTHKFKMKDEYHITAQMLRPDGTVCTSVAILGNLWPALNFPEASSGYASVAVPPIYDWNDGEIVSVGFVFTTDGTSAGNAVFQIRAATPANLGGMATPSVNENAVVAVNATANVHNQRTYTLSTPIAYTRSDSLLLRIDRLPADASDTHTNNIKLLGLVLNYEGEGPDSGGSGAGVGGSYVGFSVTPDGV